MIRYTTSFPVRYYECDPMGIVHHSNYLRYFECARDEMIDSWGYGIEKCQEDGLTFPLVSAQLRFHRPARSGDTLRITADIADIPMAKLIVNQQIFNQKGELCCEGTVTLGFLNAETGRPMRCPEKFLSLIEKANV